MPTNEGSPSTRRLRSVAPAMLLALLLPVACQEDDKKNEYAPPPPPEVIVAAPTMRNVVTYLKYTGVVEASETVELRARVQGFLEKVNFQPGQKVKKGDLLFVIDKRQFIAAVDQADAEVRSQQAALLGAENDARLARQLADQSAGPEIDAIIKAAKRDAIDANLAAARAKLSEAKLNLEYCEITAPIDGRISRNEVDAGNLVGRGEPTLLAKIVQATPAYVSADVSETDVLAARRARQKENSPATDASAQSEPGQIAPGQWRPCELSLSDEEEYNTEGRIDYVAPEINSQTGTLRVRTRFENANETLFAGLFAKLRFPMSSREAMLVPDAALLSDQQGRYALVVNSKDEVEVRRVVIGGLDEGMRIVEEGLKADDRVVVLGVLKARPGSKVTPKVQEAAAPNR